MWVEFKSMSRSFDKEEEKWRIMNTRHGVTFPVSGTYVAVYFRGLSVLPSGMIAWQTGKMIREIDLIRDTAMRRSKGLEGKIDRRLGFRELL